LKFAVLQGFKPEKPQSLTQKSDRKALFYPANRIEPKVRSTPDNRDFCGTDGTKIHKRTLAHSQLVLEQAQGIR
jgi:hypothetical protein